MKKINNEKILLIFISILPILDILSFLFRNYFGTTFSPSTFIKPLIPISIFVYIFIKYKFKAKIFLVAVIYALYGLLHLYFFNKCSSGISYGTVIHEAQYIINYTFAILSLFIFLFIFNNNDCKKISKAILITNGIYILSIFIAILTKTSSTTYIEGQGFKGWFESGNSLSAILVLNLFIILTILGNKESKCIKIIATIELIFSAIFLAMFLGTRTGLLGLVLVIGLFVVAKTFDFIKNWIINNSYKLKQKIVSIFLILGVFSIIIFIAIKGSTYLSRRKYLNSLNSELIDKSTGQTAHITGDLLNLKEQIESGEIDEEYINQEYQKSIIELYNSANKYKLDSTNRRAQQLIFNYYLVKNQANVFTILFGNGFLNNYGELILEMEIPAWLFNFGIIGLILYFIPFFTLFIYYCYIGITNIKKVNYEFIFLLSGNALSFVLSFFIGQIYFNPSAVIIITCINVLLFNKCSKLKKEKDIELIEAASQKQEKELITMGEGI